VGGVFVFGLIVHKQSISTHTMEMKSMPVTIPRIRSKFERLPLSEVLDNVAVGARLWGAFIGDVEIVGAALEFKDVIIYKCIDIHC